MDSRSLEEEEEEEDEVEEGDEEEEGQREDGVEEEEGPLPANNKIQVKITCSKGLKHHFNSRASFDAKNTTLHNTQQG